MSETEKAIPDGGDELGQASAPTVMMVEDEARIAMLVPVLTAGGAADAAFAMLDRGSRFRRWLTLGDEDALPSDAIYVAALESLARFVRMSPDAPAEALYRHARAQAIHDGAADGWPSQAIGVRLAYSVFRMTLIATDALLLDEERRAAAAAAGREPAPAGTIPIEDTTLAAALDPSAIHDDLVRDRHTMKLIPAKGLPPGHRAEIPAGGKRKRGGAWDLPDGPLGRSGEEPTKPPPEIGPDNMFHMADGEIVPGPAPAPKPAAPAAKASS